MVKIEEIIDGMIDDTMTDEGTIETGTMIDGVMMIVETGKPKRVPKWTSQLMLRDYRPRRDIDDPYGGRSRRDDDRRRSPR